MKRQLRAAGRVLLGVLFPPRCLACRGFMSYEEALQRELASPDLPHTREDTWFCRACLPRLPHLRPPICQRCARPAEIFLDDPSPPTSSSCPSCTDDPPPFEQARALYEYGGAARDAIHHLKFRRDVPVAKGLGALLAHNLTLDPLDPPLPTDALVVPVPLDPVRGRDAPFNHAGLIAQRAAHRLGLQLSASALTRTRSTEPQRDLDREARLTNLKDAFEATPTIKGRSVLLIDDVMTTGATVTEATQALKSAGASRVWVAVVCRT